MPEPEDEAARVRAAYARRAERGLDERYAYWEPANLFIYQARERAVLQALRDTGMLPLSGRCVLDVGCGDGRVLQDFLRYGAEESNLAGVDLLADRVSRAQEHVPLAKVEVGDARNLEYPDGSFDVVLGFTMLSSIVDRSARRRVATGMARVVKPGGVILVYDFWINPTNRDVRPLSRSELRSLFPGCKVDFQGLTLAPPILRLLIDLPGGWLACSALEMLPFLRTHYLAAVHPQSPPTGRI